jgi:hypothetical protein
MTLGGAAKFGVRLIIWCKACQHQVEPDPAEMAERYGADTPVLDWRDRLVCSRCGSRRKRLSDRKKEPGLSTGLPRLGLRARIRDHQ